MSVMSVLDLQCTEAMDAIELTIDHMGYQECDLIPALVIVEIVQQAAFQFTPVDAWECTLPYLLTWAYERHDVLYPRLN